MNNDTKKLIFHTKKLQKKHSIFTSEMVYDYILNNNVKFHKVMTKKRLAQYIHSCGEFQRVYKKDNKNYYTLK